MYFNITHKDKSYRIDIDYEDWPEVKKHKWRVLLLYNNKVDIYTSIKRRTTALHRLVLGIPVGDKTHISHKDGNGCNNQKENLVIFDRNEELALLRSKRAKPKVIKEIKRNIINIRELDEEKLEVDYTSKRGKKAVFYINKQDLSLVENKQFIINRGDHTNYISVFTDGDYKRLHRLIMGDPPKGCQIDHIDRNGLNNCRDNLRVVRCGVNVHNSRIYGKLNYKGVALNRHRYSAIVFKNKIRWYLGSYSNPEVAALAYDIGVKLIYKEEATINGIAPQKEYLEEICNYKFTKTKSKTGKYMLGEDLFKDIDIEEIANKNIGQKLNNVIQD